MSSIMLISSHVDDQNFAEEVANSSGLPLISEPNPVKAREKLVGLVKPVLFVDVSSDEMFNEFVLAFKPIIGEGPGQISSNLVHFISPETLEKASTRAETNMFGHLIMRQYGDPREAGRHYGRIVKGVCLNQDFGLQNLISSEASIRIVKLGHSSDKSRVMTSISEYLSTETSFKDRAAQIVITAVDELLMNAIYDAPPDEAGGQKLQKVSRDTPISLGGKRAVELQMGYDGEYVAFTVIDRFGSINKSKVLKHLFRNFAETDYQVDPNVAGAGIGLATTFRTGGSLLFIKDPFCLRRREQPRCASRRAQN